MHKQFISRATATAPKYRHIKRVVTALLFYTVAVLATILASAAFGQITVPAESKEHTPIPVTLKAMVPDGATIQSGAGLVWPEGVNKLEVGPGQWVVCAPPGEYTITYKVRWLHIVPITFKDFDGKEVTFQNYLGSGDVDEQATFKVLGGTPPVPPPPPPPPGTRWGLILRETNNGQSPQLGNLLIKLRQEFQDSRLVIHDPTSLPSLLKPLVPPNQALPALMVIARQTDGSDKLVRAVPISATTTVEVVKQEMAR